MDLYHILKNNQKINKIFLQLAIRYQSGNFITLYPIPLYPYIPYTAIHPIPLYPSTL
jgi:hypothetical protein